MNGQPPQSGWLAAPQDGSIPSAGRLEALMGVSSDRWEAAQSPLAVPPSNSPGGASPNATPQSRGARRTMERDASKDSRHRLDPVRSAGDPHRRQGRPAEPRVVED